MYVLLTFLGPNAAIGEQEPSKLDTLLERIAFNNAEKPETLGGELAELDAAELAKLCDMLVEPGAGDDTQPRMALHALVLYAGHHGTDAQHDRLVAALCAALRSDRPDAVKAFLIRQLQLAGNEHAVPALAALLSDEKLCEPATQALLAIGGSEVGEAFAKALPSAAGENRVTIVKALRVFPQRAAVPSLLKDAISEDWNLRVNALGALAASGDPAATETLLTAARTDARQERSQATGYLLEFAEALAAAGHQEHAAGVYHDLMATRTAQQEIHTQCAALRGLAGLLGGDAVGEVVAALSSKNPELRAAAVNIAVTVSGEAATEAYVKELETASAVARAGILTVLARRGDAAALPAALSALKDADKDVRIAAVQASAALGREKATDALVAFLDTDQADEREAAAQALAGLPGEQVSAQLTAAIKWSPARVRSALLDVLARRGARAQLDAIYEHAADTSEAVRIAAINAVGALANEEAVSKLAKLLRRADSEAERAALETALVATAKRAPSPFKRVAYVIVSIKQDDTREYCSLLRVLGRIGQWQGIKTIRNATQDPRRQVREAAIRAFLDWPDATAIDDVLDVAREAEELNHHVLAMRAYARQMGLEVDRPIEDTFRLFNTGMDVARRVDEKRLLLSRLADVKDARVFDKLADYLDDEALRAEAGSAMIGVAHGILPAGWAPAREALDAVLDKVDDERVRRHAKDVMKEVAEHEDYVTDWLVAGPFQEQGKDGRAIFDVVFPPERPGAKDVQWKPQPVTKDPAQYWFIDLERSVGGDNCAAYLRTHVWSPEKQDVLLELGSDDAIKVWLNGEVIHANNVPRGCDRGQDKVTTSLNEGWNELMLKVVDFGGAWAASLRVRTLDGGRLAGLRIDANAQP